MTAERLRLEEARAHGIPFYVAAPWSTVDLETADGSAIHIEERSRDEVARIGGFGFEIVDMSDVFASTVLADFFEEHEAGRTPNPCARCNEQIKFGAFLDRADQLGVDFVATGHYVRTDAVDGRWRLLRGLDRSKDQSYMLYTVGQRELARSRLPLQAQRPEIRRPVPGSDSGERAIPETLKENN